jgi:hypothetical protein
MNQSVVNKMNQSINISNKNIVCELSYFEYEIRNKSKENNALFMMNGERSLTIMIEKGLIHSIKNVSIKIENGFHVLKYNGIYIHNGVNELSTRFFKRFPYDLMLCIKLNRID